MRVDVARLVPLPGTSGLACRFPGVALFVAAGDATGIAGELVERCRQASTAIPESGVDAGTTLARRVSQVVATAPADDRPAFGLVATTADGPLVVVHGAVVVTASTADLVAPGGQAIAGDSVLVAGADADDPAGCVERRLGANVSTITVSPDRPTETTPPASESVDLERGIVVADGFRLVARATADLDDDDQSTRSATAWYANPDLEEAAKPTALNPTAAPTPVPGASPWIQTPPPDPAFQPPTPAAETPAVPFRPPAPAPETPAVPFQPPAPAPQTPAVPFQPPAPAAGPPPTPSGTPPSFRSVSLFGADDDPAEPRKPLPVMTDPVEVRSAEAEIGQVVVQGVVCPRGHFNDPRARFCSSCGISMAHQTRTLVPGPRPPLGVLVFDDGTTYSLSSNYVVGRQPESHQLVQARHALPLVLEDGRRTISRAHAEIRLDGWDVHFVNLSATNGSYLWDQQYQQWRALTPGQPVVLAPGMRLAMGQRTAIFESALVR